MLWQARRGLIAGRAALDSALGSTDPFFSNVVLLMPCEGTNGSTGAPGFTDLSPSGHTVTAQSGCVISTAQKEYGSSSIDTHTAGALSADSADWLLSSSNSDQFTIEFSHYLNSTGSNKIFMCQYTVDGTVSWSIQTDGSSHYSFGFSPDGTFASYVQTASSGSPATGSWVKVAIDKNGAGKIRLYVAGSMVASSTPANSAFSNSSVSLGIGQSAAAAGVLDGYLDNIRITKGVARYASDGGYTPATAAFPTS